MTDPSTHPPDDPTGTGSTATRDRRRPRWTGPLVLGAALLSVILVTTGFSPSSGSTSAATTSPLTAASKGTVHARNVAGVGTVLVNRAGRTLYLFNPDQQKKVTCTGRCAKAWPPLYTTGKPVAGSGIKASSWAR